MVSPYRVVYSTIEMLAVDRIAIDAVFEIVPETIVVVSIKRKRILELLEIK